MFTTHQSELLNAELVGLNFAQHSFSAHSSSQVMEQSSAANWRRRHVSGLVQVWKLGDQRVRKVSGFQTPSNTLQAFPQGSQQS